VKRRYAVPLLVVLLGLSVMIVYLAQATGQIPPNPPRPTSEEAKGPAPALERAGDANRTEVRTQDTLEVEEVAGKADPLGQNGAGRQAFPKPPAGEKSGPAATDLPGRTSGGSTPAPSTGEQRTGETGAGATGGKPADAAHAVVVGVAVVGKDGELLFGPAEVKISPENPWGATALGALEATGLPYALSPRFPDLVEAIAGQRNQGLSGWMYQVNGEVPMVAASRKPVKPGDRVIWWYSQDLSQPPPRWEELADKR
jgi:hypothetical protein